MSHISGYLRYARNMRKYRENMVNSGAGGLRDLSGDCSRGYIQQEARGTGTEG